MHGFPYPSKRTKLDKNIWNKLHENLCFFHLLQLWAKNSGLAFQLSDFGDETNIAMIFRYIDGPYNTVGVGFSPTPHLYSTLELDSAENWKIYGPSDHTGLVLPDFLNLLFVSQLIFYFLVQLDLFVSSL